MISRHKRIFYSVRNVQNIVCAQILIYQTIRNFIPCSPEVHYTGLYVNLQPVFYYLYENDLHLKSQKRPNRTMFVHKIQVNPIHTILKYGTYYNFMNR